MSIYAANAPVADNIKRILREKGLKNNYIAQTIGYSSQELSGMLNGRKIIKASDIPKICLALSVNAAELFREIKAV